MTQSSVLLNVLEKVLRVKPSRDMDRGHLLFSVSCHYGLFLSQLVLVLVTSLIVCPFLREFNVMSVNKDNSIINI